MNDIFIRKEVEKTPAQGLNTLYVVGLQNGEDIFKLVDQNEYIEHIHFGANNSFPILETNDYDNWKQWENMIKYNLDRGVLCSLTLDSNCVEGLVEGSLVEYNNFMSIVSVRLPYINLLGYNATIKLDDNVKTRTNPGVWCHSVHDLKNREHFTDWSKYVQREIQSK
jgi:hypothetical protein